jgi:hypothetical protein
MVIEEETRARPPVHDPAALLLGTVSWVQQTSGWLTPAERRSLLRPLARSHARNAIGRLAMVVRLNSGRRAYLPASRLVPPSTVLTRAAEDRACGMMPAAWSTTATGATCSVEPSASSKARRSTTSCCSPPRCCTTRGWSRRLGTPTSHPRQRPHRTGRRRAGGPVERRQHDHADRHHLAPQSRCHRRRRPRGLPARRRYGPSPLRSAKRRSACPWAGPGSSIATAPSQPRSVSHPSTPDPPHIRPLRK